MNDYLTLLTHKATVEERQQAGERAAMYTYATEQTKVGQRLAHFLGRSCVRFGARLLSYGHDDTTPSLVVMERHGWLN